MNSDEILLSIRISDLQHESRIKLGRELDYKELHIARKALESALLFGIDSIYNTILFEMISNERSNH